MVCLMGGWRGGWLVTWVSMNGLVGEWVDG